ncbi:hypothetical protein EVAR_10108_1 [Eumeta japonica]|uniref:Uncharacterized protein n=1 Tax=Eumeta variegata TaxID=151549 RepID=A0A4C1UD07_EUMVA|nr:hypothetical protein EVAR_10108_1 [Eumeta japonica]
MVPFYENDVLIQIPKSQKKNLKGAQHSEKNSKKRTSALSTEAKSTQKNYLINHLKTKKERNSYLEAFRKRFPQFRPEEKSKDIELDSMYPEFGDTERESIGEESCPNTAEFYNTEVYNELFYEKLLEERFDRGCSLSSSLDDQTTSPNEIRTKHSETHDKINSRIRSERQRRPLRRRSTPPMAVQSPGGLGPDMEKIRPRLERARSLQRYSEKVRMENRLRIYKNAVQKEKEKTDRENLRQLSAKRGVSINETGMEGKNFKISYLVNSTLKESATKEKSRNFHESKAKSADVTKRRNTFYTRDEKATDEPLHNSRESNQSSNEGGNAIFFKKDHGNANVNDKGERNKNPRNTCTGKTRGSPPVQINFSVNVGQMKPTSALRNLEEKHRLYQEKVKSFMVDYHLDT